MSSPKVRDWFYYRARKPTADDFTWLARPGQIVTVIGDATKPGKSQEAIASAFRRRCCRRAEIYWKISLNFAFKSLPFFSM